MTLTQDDFIGLRNYSRAIAEIATRAAHAADTQQVGDLNEAMTLINKNIKSMNALWKGR